MSFHAKAVWACHRKGNIIAKVLKYVLGMDNKNRFESFYSAGAPAQDFVRYSAVDNLDGHVTDEEFDVEFFSIPLAS